MIWLKLSILVIFASSCDSVLNKKAESHLVYVLETSVYVHSTFYLTNLYLENPKSIIRLQGSYVDKMYLSKDKSGLIVYWSQKSSSLIWRYEVSPNKMNIKSFIDNAIFLGLGDNDTLYLYSPSSKSISVYEFYSGKKVLELKGLEHSSTDMHSVDVDPRDRERLFFAECSKNNFTGRVYDISDNAILKDYEQALPTCFDTWRITPDGERAYAVKGKKVYISPSESAQFVENYKAVDDIVGFAVGNNEFFYGNEGKNEKSMIFKVSTLGNNSGATGVGVNGFVKHLALYTPPNCYYLIYAIESDGFLEFAHADLDLRKSKSLLKINTNGQVFDKMFLGYSESGEVVYWSYKNSNFLGRFEVNIRKEEERYLNQKFGTLLGAGNIDKIYFYHSDNKTFTVYDYKNDEVELQLVISEETDMHCVDIDPRNREQIFFAECFNTGKKFSKVLDLKWRKVLHNHTQELPVCFDSWGIAPNGKSAYAVHGQMIYRSPTVNAPFSYYIPINKDIQAFAVGNNEFFYATKQTKRKILKMITGNKEVIASNFDVKGNLKALVVHQGVPPKHYYLIYAMENKGFLEFVETDLDFKETRTLLKMDVNNQIFDKMYLGYSEHGAIIYWTYKNSNIFGRLEVTTAKDEQRYLNKKLGTFLGAGNNDKTYFFNSDKRTLTVYDYKSGAKELLVDIIPEDAGMHYVDIDPHNREQILFAECMKNGTNFVKVFDVKRKKVLDDKKHKHVLSKCFETWRITPNGESAYAILDLRIIYEKPEGGNEYHMYDWIEEDIEEIAVGNNEIFYTTTETGGKKIFKSVRKIVSEFKTEGVVKAMVIREDDDGRRAKTNEKSR